MEFCENLIRPGVESLSLAEMINDNLLKNGADPGPIICISPEDTVWHGIPDKRILLSGEIVSIDIACSVRGWWADSARTFALGNVDSKRKLLMISAWEGTRRITSVMKDGMNGIESAQTLSDLCSKRDVTLITEGAGHGIGRRLHEMPSLTYDGRKHEALSAGRLYTAEPIFSSGRGEILISSDGSALTVDSEPSAHFEVTLLLLKHGAHILGAAEWFDHPPC